jgi:hypothetical protein
MEISIFIGDHFTKPIPLCLPRPFIQNFLQSIAVLPVSAPLGHTTSICLATGHLDFMQMSKPAHGILY